MYEADFQCRKKDRAESWGDFADALKILVEKAFPNLEAAVKENLALNQCLTQLENPQISFGVKQRWPSSLVEVVSFTIEMESYLQKPVKLAPVMTEEPSVVSTIQNQQGELVKTLEEVTQWLKRLDASMQALPVSQTRRSANQYPSQQNRNQPVVCHKCKKEGYYARGCPAVGKLESFHAVGQAW